MVQNDKSTNVPRNIYVKEAAPNVDFKYGPFASKREAVNKLFEWGALCEGLTVGITTNGKTEDYQFQGGIDEAHLVKKNAADNAIGFESDENGELLDPSGLSVEELTAMKQMVKDGLGEKVNDIANSLSGFTFEIVYV